MHLPCNGVRGSRILAVKKEMPANLSTCRNRVRPQREGSFTVLSLRLAYLQKTQVVFTEDMVKQENLLKKDILNILNDKTFNGLKD